ncbi:SUMF1/EgtB/PvdO family nonheme iron enzyme [Xenophilus arseniciresistens]|uniref:SUMF1/EgtB/PvdO family nonheme iron enzyme n=1 Tax=Xenophilus arseniciresistens TaxID=1283306 RepID=A0AAE3N730_9BURK|nr:SUMF1/EgtB/PvdO family nonheme iron enzyme [Xenophilus arseniciresistens]MDA7417180.1 SUMF1/EgtB/PvdO family nonheme iron enzyme [Xenophilus arseniciresistens]
MPLFEPMATRIDSPAMREAGAPLLSLALMDARNHTLRLLSWLDHALAADGPRRMAELPPELPPPHWLAGHIGWLAEAWIARNTQRALGAACPARPTRLASLDAGADAAWDPQCCPSAQRAGADVPALEQARAYLLDTLEGTLELLERAEPDDAGLYFYRMALFYEDWCGEQLQVIGQTLGLAPDLPEPTARVAREPLWLPATTWTVGWGARAGFHWAQEGGALELAVPEFEIDAQAVSWQQYAEFVADGGYDQASLWHPEGWAWVQAQDRRAPRHVAQIGAHAGADATVLAQRGGRLVRLPGGQPAQHLSWWEADAWARWAGRRLPTEAEWEVAASTAARRGFIWGEVQEWVANRLQPWPGFAPDPWSAGTALDPQPAWGRARVLRGASSATHARARSVRARLFADPGTDTGFTGFRTCAI